MDTIAHQPVALPLGQVVMTRGVADLVGQGTLNPQTYLRRHMFGDWGDLSNADKQANQSAVRNGDRVLSSYTIATGLKIWVITEYDRSVTTLLLPEEY